MKIRALTTAFLVALAGPATADDWDDEMEWATEEPEDYVSFEPRHCETCGVWADSVTSDPGFDDDLDDDCGPVDMSYAKTVATVYSDVKLYGYGFARSTDCEVDSVSEAQGERVFTSTYSSDECCVGWVGGNVKMKIKGAIARGGSDTHGGLIGAYVAHVKTSCGLEDAFDDQEQVDLVMAKVSGKDPFKVKVNLFGIKFELSFDSQGQYITTLPASGELAVDPHKATAFYLKGHGRVYSTVMAEEDDWWLLLVEVETRLGGWIYASYDPTEEETEQGLTPCETPNLKLYDKPGSCSSDHCTEDPGTDDSGDV